MNKIVSISDALDIIPEFSNHKVKVKALRSGLTNRNYLILKNKDKFVLRLNNVSSLLKNNRKNEISILKRAFKEGLAPRVVYSNIRRGILLTEYLEGDNWNETDLRNKNNLELLAKLLRKVHALPSCGASQNYMKIANYYERKLEIYPEYRRRASVILDGLRATLLPDKINCCHNDVIAANIIGKEKLKLIDWEFSTDNHPLFDIASIVIYHSLEEQFEKFLLSAYVGGTDYDAKVQLDQQKRIYYLIYWLWLVDRKSSEFQQSYRVSILKYIEKKLKELPMIP